MAHDSPDYFEGVRTEHTPIDTVLTPFARFAKNQAAGGIVLLACAIAALVIANSGLGHWWHEFWTAKRLLISLGSWVFPYKETYGSLEWWVNDAIMAAFFFVIGLEIKREILAGELRSPRKAALPIIAAIGGMVVPGFIYAALNWGQESMRGWAIPTATDIAFALGILALFGKRIPHGLRIFLATLAIADDLGALIIIAIFYTGGDNLSLPYLGMAVICMGVMGVFNMLGVRRWWVFGIVGLALWYCVLHSGVHATIAGVMGALTIPVRTLVNGGEFIRQARRLTDVYEHEQASGGMVMSNPSQQGALRAMERLTEAAQTPLQRLEKGMAPLSAFFVVPLFALANAGVSVGEVIGPAMRDAEAWGIVLGLLVGKTVGILGASWIAIRFGLSVLPEGTTWRHMLGVSLLAGIGFTMSLFIAHLAFGSSERLEIAKLAVLAASAIAAILGAAVLATCKPPMSNGH